MYRRLLVPLACGRDRGMSRFQDRGRVRFPYYRKLLVPRSSKVLLPRLKPNPRCNCHLNSLGFNRNSLKLLPTSVDHLAPDLLPSHPNSTNPNLRGQGASPKPSLKPSPCGQPLIRLHNSPGVDQLPPSHLQHKSPICQIPAWGVRCNPILPWDQDR